MLLNANKKGDKNMSLFLGKIHYLLYDKILWFESLENEIVKLAIENILPVDPWLS